ncbi:MAG: FAD-dependent oxidoreductase [Prosthecochloris sp.]|uniref:NAD(P)/FAD-dependent oxidoreductase n=1 Tax=unclassified Prosthecochloris TaxID=2632826 RepID=UPI000DF767EF|nr:MULTISPECIES: FAD-dependent oxidoreductase [unclassified Prosthecochloris]MCW8798160.1 FAD-dependent oxidoreductase [Prosthecochloris sp.]RDD29322.1 sulfide:quinone reductase [Prosthecochloris sp. ZM]
MAKVVIIGAGFAGHTAAMYLGDAIGKEHDITVIHKFDIFGFVPSWVWLGIGAVKPEETTFKLKPVYDKFNVNFVQGTVTSVHPDENYVIVNQANSGGEASVEYDYLVVATGAHMNYDATPGLGPKKFTESICHLDSAIQARDSYLQLVEKMKRGERQRLVIGTGHPMAACQGAAFEYITNIHADLTQRGVRDKAELVYLTNEPAIGDFGVNGINVVKPGGRIARGGDLIDAAMDDFGIVKSIRRGVKEVDEKKIYWEDFEGNFGEDDYDFAMLIPQSRGVKFPFFDKNGEDISSKVTNPGGFVLADGIYGLSYDELVKTPDAWPANYQNPQYPNIFSAGIAFAPPGPISVPHVTKNGTSITPGAPRTGMISGVIGRVVALNIIDLIKEGRMTHHERMSEMLAVCIASNGKSLWNGSAIVMIIYPIVPDHTRYDNKEGRDLFVTRVERGLSGAWLKQMVETTFMHKFKGNIGWKYIPE